MSNNNEYDPTKVLFLLENKIEEFTKAVVAGPHTIAEADSLVRMVDSYSRLLHTVWHVVEPVLMSQPEDDKELDS